MAKLVRRAGEWIGALATREFWTARTINAVLGATLTIGAGLASVGVGDGLRKQIADIEEEVRSINGHIDTIERAMFEFQLFESTGTLIQVLSLNQSIPDQARSAFRELMYIDRRHAYLVILSELYPQVERWRARKEEYDKVTEGARAGDREQADKVVLMERDDTIAARRLQGELIDRRFTLVERKDHVQQRLNFFTMLGFTVQQVGFVLVLFAGLVSQHLTERKKEPKPPAPETVAAD
ncbi:hypothetical protein WDZ92_42365 [Nostoc sp. NIES-2111]